MLVSRWVPLVGRRLRWQASAPRPFPASRRDAGRLPRVERVRLWRTSGTRGSGSSGITRPEGAEEAPRRWNVTRGAFVALALLGFFLIAVSPARAADDPVVSVAVSSRSIYAGQTLTLQIQVEGAQPDAPPEFPPVRGLVLKLAGQQQIAAPVTIINGRRIDTGRDRFVYQYEGAAPAPGEYQIPSVEVRIGGRAHKTEPVSIRAMPPSDDPDVRLILEVDNATPYVGEPVRLVVTLGLGKNARGARFNIPGVDGVFDVTAPPTTDQNRRNRDEFLLDILGAPVPVRAAQREIDGRTFDTVTAERIIVPKEPGRQTIGPATVETRIVVREGRWPFEEEVTRSAVAPSNSLVLDVRPLPTDGRPPAFNGLVGRYALTASADPTEVSVGDPITLTARVTGPMPEIILPPALDRQPAFDGFRAALDSGPPAVDARGKTFKYTLRAERADTSEIPPIELPYFDTASGSYDVARSKPIPLKVKSARVVTAGESAVSTAAVPLGAAIEDRVGGLRHNYSGRQVLSDQRFDLGAVVRSPTGIAAVVGPPALFALTAAGMMWRRSSPAERDRRRARRALTTARRALESVGGDDPIAIAAAVSSAVHGYFADRKGRAAHSLTTADCLDLLSGGDPQLIDLLKHLLEGCDAARYGGIALNDAQRLRAEALDLLSRIDKGIEVRT